MRHRSAERATDRAENGRPSARLRRGQSAEPAFALLARIAKQLLGRAFALECLEECDEVVLLPLAEPERLKLALSHEAHNRGRVGSHVSARVEELHHLAERAETAD